MSHGARCFARSQHHSSAFGHLGQKGWRVVQWQCPLNRLIKQLPEKGSGILLDIGVQMWVRRVGIHGLRV
jgi:adenosyl cobinamide kinase/adenosyl cobinamide phosphate guanylyltransferase